MNVKLRARVRAILGDSANFIGTIADGEPLPVVRLPDPVWLEISEEDGAYYLYYLNDQLICFADTWHQTLEGAKREAEIGFGVQPQDWFDLWSRA